MELPEKLAIGFVGLLGLGILGLIVFGIFFNIMTPGSGQHTGYVTATETYGIIWKTSRAYIKTDTQSSQEDKYCVEDPSVLEKLKIAQESKEKVTILYDSPLIMPNWKCGNEDSVIIGIK